MKLLLPALCLSLSLGSCMLDEMDDVSLDPTSDEVFADDDASVSYIGGGGCSIFSPDYPDCEEDDDWPGIEQPGCTEYAACYCVCRAVHQCWNDSSQCGPLGQCLNQCDANQPSEVASCPYPSQPAQPTSILQCL